MWGTIETTAGKTGDQNRQAAKDRLEAHYDYEINLKAEMEIMGLHTKLDELRDDQWTELVALQKRQLELLEEIRGTVLSDPQAGIPGKGAP